MLTKSSFNTMQVFLPLPNVHDSLETLDKQRLNKQTIEISQILNVILTNGKAWANHPATLMIRGFESFGVYYGLVACEIAKNRGINCSNIQNTLESFAEKFNLSVNSPTYPSWFGDEQFHKSHRAKLLYKGRIDAVCYSIRRALGVPSINEWLASHNLPPKNQLMLDQTISLEIFAKDNKIEVMPNHYKQFGWKENDDNLTPYYWPVKK
jgi:hypothetical protein